MHLCGRRIHAHANIPDISLSQQRRHLRRNQGSVGRYHHANALLFRMKRKREEILAHQRLPPGYDQHRHLKTRHFINETYSFLKRPFIRMRRSCIHVAVFAREIALAGDVPHNYRLDLG